jgi:putative FmdB family regulatory protein
MPTYVYRREDGTKFEIKQRITEDPLEKCPETGQSVERIIAGSAGLIFKGDGFYVNDYAKSNGSRKDANGTSDSAAAAESSPESSSKTEGTASGDGTSTEKDTASSSASDA